MARGTCAPVSSSAPSGCSRSHTASPGPGKGQQGQRCPQSTGRCPAHSTTGHFPVRLGKQRAGKCWAAAARGSVPCHPSVHLLPRGISMWDVIIGATDLSQPGPKAAVRRIQRLLVHQHYVAATARNDIALLELDQPVECSDYIQLGCVPDASLRVSELKSCYIAGWNFARGELPSSMCAPRASWAPRGHGPGTDRVRPQDVSGAGLAAARAGGRSPRQDGAWNGMSCKVPAHPNNSCWPREASGEMGLAPSPGHQQGHSWTTSLRGKGAQPGPGRGGDGYRAAGGSFPSVPTAQGTGMVLQESKVHLMDMELCNSSRWYAGAIHPRNLCAGYPHGGIDTCQQTPQSLSHLSWHRGTAGVPSSARTMKPTTTGWWD
ncbi:uncharacterized protein LOC119708865 isoform X4 [Motacilla alba alba]|uniref:uncharacterized protein LOC119708865 isoform X4 n=1 Tax=Motacilla alba alba TaxID=1094192 RepID=UPI0018D4F168|nr:uncharacterized protein LOC119708865 isoform X4 [Motacilla alba alba]